jgi:ribose/xylose/arabinose/galactoside ABC-type transport system permease subunit
MNAKLMGNDKKPNGGRLKTWAIKYNTVVVLLIIFIFFAFASDSFLKPTNLMNVLRQISINGIIATGMTLVILTGGIEDRKSVV